MNDKQRTPWFYVPSLYFAEGLPYIIINTVSVIMYKNLGISNERIGLWTSLLYLPWVLKMIWAPLLDIIGTKRRWLLSTQFLLGLVFMGAGVAAAGGNFFFPSLALFAAGAFISATHDISIDGFYMLAMPEKEQAFFVGIRVVAYRMAMIFGSGGLVYLSGQIAEKTGSANLAWAAGMLVPAVLFLLMWVWHRFVLPHPAVDRPGVSANRFQGFFDAIEDYFKQDKILFILFFILLYRFGEAMLMKMASPFLMDAAARGGLGVSTSEIGILYGTVGMLALITGGIFGGWILSKYGLRKCIWPMSLALNLPDLFYCLLASVHLPAWALYPLIAAEQFGAGLGFMAYTVFLMSLGSEKFKTSHFAISTGLMGLGMMLPGMASGYLQAMLGYKMFFYAVFLITIPGMLLIPFIPIKQKTA
ncbi:MAG: MFS transporter [Elusimicrobiaceae bacterium]|jgi:PAT family beta-lactamase induction signal transducer AmpG